MRLRNDAVDTKVVHPKSRFLPPNGVKIVVELEPSLLYGLADPKPSVGDAHAVRKDESMKGTGHNGLASRNGPCYGLCRPENIDGKYAIVAREASNDGMVGVEVV